MPLAAKDRRKKGSKTRSKELNARGEKMEGSDMDAFTDVKESKEVCFCGFTIRILTFGI